MTPIPADSAARGRRSPRRPYRFGTQEIASAADRSIETIRKDRQRGILDPESLVSVANYIARARGWMHLQIPDPALREAVITFFDAVNLHFTNEQLPKGDQSPPRIEHPPQVRAGNPSQQPHSGDDLRVPPVPVHRKESEDRQEKPPESSSGAEQGDQGIPATQGRRPDQSQREAPSVLDPTLPAGSSHGEAAPATPAITFPRWNRVGANLAYYFARAGSAPVPYTRGQILSEIEVLQYQEGPDQIRRSEELKGVLKLLNQP